MERINTYPPGSTTYRMDDGRIFRVHLSLVTSPEALATGDRIEVLTRGYQLTEEGSFVTDSEGEPVTIKEQRAIIPMGNIRNGTASVKPGWLKLPEDQQTVAESDDDPLDTIAQPGSEGDVRRMEDGFLYRWTDGEYELIRMRRLADAPPAPQPPLDPAVIADFTP